MNLSDKQIKTLQTFLESIKDPKDFADYEKNKEIKARWIRIFKMKNIPAFEVVSVDKKQSFSYFNQIVADTCFELFQNTKNTSYLDEACQHGSYYALAARLEQSVKEFDELKEKNSKAARLEQSVKEFDELKEKNSNPALLKKIVDDCKQVGNYFWTPGYILAAQYLLVLAHKLHSANLLPVAAEFYTASLECVFMAKYLENHSMSQDCIEVLFQGKDIAAGLGFQYNNWDEAIEGIRTRAGLQMADVEKIRQGVKEKIQNLYPDLDLGNNDNPKP